MQYNQMLKDFAALGFRRDPADVPADDEPIDQNATRLRGTIPPANARKLLLERHVRSILLIPAGQKLPEDANQLVRVEFDLADGLAPDRQRLLAEQTVQVLSSLKFQEAVGYDRRGFTRILGTLPAGQIETVLNDLRKLPDGQKMPAPFAGVAAIRVIEIRPDLPLPLARPIPPAVPAGPGELDSELRDVLADAARADKPTRFEILLANEPQAETRTGKADYVRPHLASRSKDY